MAEPVNLNRFRKNQARAEKKARANQNAVKFARNKAEKQLDRRTLEKARRDLDGHQSEP
ncbi:MAG: DUF4169 family protein [Rhodobacteraceae bacterium]|nr:DUF4169 family protein [Paracoccaceae bacterium]